MRLVMMGTGSFAAPTFAGILASSHSVVGLFTQPDRATGKERGSTRQAGQPMKELALRHAIPVFQPESVNTTEGVESLQALQPDLLVVAAYGQILSRDVLAVPRLGGINVHASLLPKYRGAAPINWAIYHGETTTGVSIIRMTTGLDAGDILAQAELAIEDRETAGALEARLGLVGAQLVSDVIEHLAHGPVVGVPQDRAQATKAPKLKKENGLIDWSRAAHAVCNQVRAMQPWPTAYTYLHQADHPPLRLIINSAWPYAALDALPDLPVAYVRNQDDHLLVRAGEGWVELNELQPAGKRRMAAREFLRGYPLHGDAWLGGEAS